MRITVDLADPRWTECTAGDCRRRHGRRLLLRPRHTLGRRQRQQHVIAIVTGTFQDEAGCENDNDPACLRGWLQDPDGDGTYTATVPAEPGDYEALVAHNESDEETYGLEGEAGGEPYTFTVPEDAASIFFSFDTGTNVLTISTAGPPKGDIAVRSAYWVARDTIAWNVDTAAAENYSLFYDLNGRLSLGPEGVSGDSEIALTLDENGLDESITTKFPHLTGFAALKIGEDDLGQVRIALKGQFAVAATDGDGSALLMPPGCKFLAYWMMFIPTTGRWAFPLKMSVPTLTVWAPTARAARVLLFNDADSEHGTRSGEYAAHPQHMGTWACNRRSGLVSAVSIFMKSRSLYQVKAVLSPNSRHRPLFGQFVDQQQLAARLST